MKTTKKAKEKTSLDKYITKEKRSLAMKRRWAEIKEQQTREANEAEATRLRGQVSVIPEPKKANNAGVLSASEINDIIQTCHANNVLSLQLGGLHLVFKKTIDEPTTSLTNRRPGSVLPQIEGASRGEHLQEMSDLAAEELEYMKINDPVAYENFIQSEDLADDGD